MRLGLPRERGPLENPLSFLVRARKNGRGVPGRALRSAAEENTMDREKATKLVPATGTVPCYSPRPYSHPIIYMSSLLFITRVDLPTDSRHDLSDPAEYLV